MGQTPIPLDGGGRTALENVQGGAVRLRAPGNLVAAGVARAQAFNRGADIGVDVTDTERPTSAQVQLLADSIDIFFEQLNLAIQLFEDLLLRRAGPSGRQTLNNQVP